MQLVCVGDVKFLFPEQLVQLVTFAAETYPLEHYMQELPLKYVPGAQVQVAPMPPEDVYFSWHC